MKKPSGVWPKVQSNRHKANKKSAVSIEHLTNRAALLSWNLLDITRSFDLHGHRPVLRAIANELSVIEAELVLRAKPSRKKKATPEVVEPDESMEPGQIQSLWQQYELVPSDGYLLTWVDEEGTKSLWTRRDYIV